jgi:hypothetical protein
MNDENKLFIINAPENINFRHKDKENGKDEKWDGKILMKA